MTTREELPKKIAVLMGGPGSEREVSLATGRGVAKALRSLGAEVVEIDVRNEDFQLPNDVDLAFITIHGTFGEDGQIQKILERRGIAYTGDGVNASETAFDKIHTKEKFREHGITTPPWEVIHAGQRPTITLPIVVKAPRQGSTVGVVIVKNEGEVESAIGEAAKYGRELLIEKFVSGRELTTSIRFSIRRRAAERSTSVRQTSTREKQRRFRNWRSAHFAQPVCRCTRVWTQFYPTTDSRTSWRSTPFPA